MISYSVPSTIKKTRFSINPETFKYLNWKFGTGLRKVCWANFSYGTNFYDGRAFYGVRITNELAIPVHGLLMQFQTNSSIEFVDIEVKWYAVFFTKVFSQRKWLMWSIFRNLWTGQIKLSAIDWFIRIINFLTENNLKGVILSECI